MRLPCKTCASASKTRPSLMPESRLQLLEDALPPPPPPAEPTVNKVAGDLVLLALRSLSARAITALGSLFTLATVGSAWWLWYATPEPSPYQLVKLAMYGLFVLCANWIVRRK